MSRDEVARGSSRAGNAMSTLPVMTESATRPVAAARTPLGLRWRWILGPAILGGLLLAAAVGCPTPDALQGEMWRLRSDVLTAVRADDRPRLRAALSAWQSQCRWLPWSTLLHERRWNRDERQHVAALQDQLSRLQAAAASDVASSELPRLTLELFDSHRLAAGDKYLHPELPPAAAGTEPLCYDGRAHGLFELPAETAVPTVSLAVSPDRKAGWNLQVTTTGFRFAPEHASGEHQPGEGHGHVYVDGKKVARLYCEWYYLGELPPGDHLIQVTLNTNDHQDLAQRGQRLEASAKVTVPDSRLTALFGIPPAKTP